MSSSTAATVGAASNATAPAALVTAPAAPPVPEAEKGGTDFLEMVPCDEPPDVTENTRKKIANMTTSLGGEKQKNGEGVEFSLPQDAQCSCGLC